MVILETSEPTLSVPCLRTYGRAEVALRGYVESPLGRIPCWVRDLSFGGARLETEHKFAQDQSIWLSLTKLRIFGTVKWVRGNLVGMQFEEKLPKSVLLNLRGEAIDPEVLAEMETMLAARNWVIGTPIDRAMNGRLAEVLGARPKPVDQPLTMSGQAPEGFLPIRAPMDQSDKRGAAAVIVMSAAIGVLAGLGSIHIF
jgi:hypothetical protein